MVQVVDDPKKVEDAYARKYENLVRKIAPLVPGKSGTLAEIGCGEGQLTIPLAKLLPAIDSTWWTRSLVHTQRLRLG